MEIRIKLDPKSNEMCILLDEIETLTSKLSRAVRDLEILQKQQNSAIALADNDAEHTTY